MRESSSLRLNLLPLHFTACCPKFDHIVVMQFAHAAHILEMVQAIFYAIVIKNAAELRLILGEIEESLILVLQELRWDIVKVWMLSIKDKLKDAPVSLLVEIVYNPQPCAVATSRPRDTPTCRATRNSIKIPLPLYVPLMRGVCVTANLVNRTLSPFSCRSRQLFAFIAYHFILIIFMNGVPARKRHVSMVDWLVDTLGRAAYFGLLPSL